MSKLILSERELNDLTLKKQTKKQAEILAEWGIPHVLGKDGILRVLRQHLNAPLYAESSRTREVGPNLEGLARR